MLTDAQVRKALPREKDYKLADEKGLYLFVTTKGFKSWRYKYRHAGKEHRLTFGAYPEVSLAQARDKRDAACQPARKVDPLSAPNIDPFSVSAGGYPGSP